MMVAIVALCFCTAAAAETFQFDWPHPVTVVVDAKLAKKGNRSTARYVVDLKRHGDAEYALEFRDFRFLSLNGKDAQDPQVIAQLGPVAALTSSLPTMHLSNDGAYLGTLGLETMMERFLALMPDRLDATARRRMDNYFRSPQVQSMMQQKSGEVWNTWVGSWNGLELVAGQSLRGRVPITLMNRELEQSVLVEHLGRVQGEEARHCTNCVRLRLTTVVEGPEVLQLVSGMLRELGDQAGNPANFVSARSMSVTEVVTEPRTLMPRYAVSNTEVMLRDADEQSISQHDRKEYWFSW